VAKSNDTSHVKICNTTKYNNRLTTMMDVKLHESIIYPKQSDFQMLQELIFNP
jgi:hypothetical protein